mgnify:CR=1 FL=1
MFIRKQPSDDRKFYLVKFVSPDGVVLLDGSHAYRLFSPTPDPEKIRGHVERLIASGRLIVARGDDHRRPTEVEVRTVGDTVEVRLTGGWGAHTIREKHTPRKIRMRPMTNLELSSMLASHISGWKIQEFLNLLEEATPPSSERCITEFDGKTVHPISMKTLLTELRLYSKGIRRVFKEHPRTIILLDRSLSMGNLWSRWREIKKVRVASFIAAAIQSIEPNTLVFSFASTVEPIEDLKGVETVEAETRLDVALREVIPHTPERLVVLTDGKPVYSESVPWRSMSEDCIRMLETLSNSGVRTLIAMLGTDEDMKEFYGRLRNVRNTTLMELPDDASTYQMILKLMTWTTS